MEQGTLYSQLKKNKILPEHEAAIIIKQITSAVEYLHDHDVAHRDIKPENIVLSNVTLTLSRTFANSATSGGLPSATKGEKLTAALSTTQLLKFLKAKNTTWVWISGV